MIHIYIFDSLAPLCLSNHKYPIVQGLLSYLRQLFQLLYHIVNTQGNKVTHCIPIGLMTGNPSATTSFLHYIGNPSNILRNVVYAYNSIS